MTQAHETAAERIATTLLEDEPARAHLEAFLVPRRAGEPVLRWTPPHLWHVTLAFMAEVPGDGLDDVVHFGCEFTDFTVEDDDTEHRGDDQQAGTQDRRDHALLAFARHEPGAQEALSTSPGALRRSLAVIVPRRNRARDK